MTEITENWYKITEKGIVLTVKLTPNSSKNEILGYSNEYIKIKVSAPPNENKANKKLVDFITEYFDTSKSNVSLISGDKSRLKKFLLKNYDLEKIKQKIYLYDKIEA